MIAALTVLTCKPVLSARLPLPAAVFVGLPICDLGTDGPGFAPTRPGHFKSFGIIAVKQQHDALVTGRVRSQIRAVHQETHGRTIGIFAIGGEHDRLFGCLRVERCSVRKKRIVAPGPQVSVQCFDAFVRGGLNDHPPAALKGFLQKRWQDLFQRLAFEMIK